MRNFIVLMNILALTLPFLAAEVQNPDTTVAEVQNQEQLACREKKDTLYDQKRILKTSVPYVLKSNLHYEPNYYPYPYIRPSVAVLPRVYYPLLKTLLFIRSPAQIYNWQPTQNFPQPTGVPHPIPSPSFLAIPPNENADNTAIPNSNTISSVESAPVPITEPVTTIVANPEASTVPNNNPETATAPESSPSA